MISIDRTSLLGIPRRLRVFLAAMMFLALPLRASAQEQVEYYGTDALGSIRIVFNADGSVKGRTDFGPYGEELTPALGQAVYAQLFRDGESGQDYAQARMYQSRTGRFNAPDPVYDGLFDPQRWNRYSYAVANPLTLTDPSGLNVPAFHSGVVGCDLIEFRSWCDFVLQMELAWYFGGGGGFGGGGDTEWGGGGGGGSTTPQNPTPPPPPPIFTPPAAPNPIPPPEDQRREPECQVVPQAPKSVSIDMNIEAAEMARFMRNSEHFGWALPGDHLAWFYNMVKNKGPWDYKQYGRQFEPFGNFNFGATGTALGLSEQILLRGAGWAQGQSGNKGAGHWLFGPYPYGDAWEDSRNIRRGIAYYTQKYVTKECK